MNANEKSIFIAVRHGDYDGGGNLSPRGTEQMQLVAAKVREINPDNLPIVILCSTAPRAKQGGELIATALGVPEERVIFNEHLWDDDHHPGNSEEAKKLIDENLQNDIILLSLSHLYMVPKMASHVAKKFGHEGRVGESRYGCGFLVNNAICSSFPQ